MVEALLRASLVESDTGRLTGQVVDLREIVEDAVARARPRADRLHADISVSLAQDVVKVKGDKSQLGRVLDNLINNSLSYSAPPARLFIEMSTDSRRAVVRVEDSGIGIRDDELEQVFERFFRRANPAVVKVPGVGLRLYISPQPAERHGGSLVVQTGTPPLGTL